MEGLRSLKVVCVQYSPELKQLEKNMKTVEEMLKKYTKEDAIDVVLLPEMAFTGYKFDDIEDLLPLPETAGVGPTFEWCKKEALRLCSYIFCGYPEVVEETNGEKKYYNS